MQVETFECEETKEETPEMGEEAIALIERLNLNGQARLIGRVGDGLGDEMKTATRCPYRKMTAEESFVYGVLCPAKTKLREYGEGPIPLRVLQVAAHADGLGIFEELHVWHVAGPSVKDPVLVATKKHPTNTWTHETFILARWGEALDEWPAMVKQAMAKFRETTRAALASIRAQVASDEAQVDAMDLAQMAAAGVPNYTNARSLW